MIIKQKIGCKKIFRNPIERTGIHGLNESAIIDPRTNIPFNLKYSPNIGIGYINGIKNSFNDFQDTLAYLGRNVRI